MTEWRVGLAPTLETRSGRDATTVLIQVEYGYGVRIAAARTRFLSAFGVLRHLGTTCRWALSASPHRRIAASAPTLSASAHLLSVGR